MTNRSRPIAILLGAMLVLSATTAMAQAEGDGPPDPVDIGSALASLAEAIDPGSPPDGDDVQGADIDPSGPSEPADIDPDSPADGDEADPGAPIEPTEPGDPAEPDGIELPEPSETEEGGFKEIQLLPDPVPKPGKWTVTNKPGLVTCDTLGNVKLRKTTQTGRITVKDEGRVLVGRSLFDGQTEPVRMRWNPDLGRYEGQVTAAADGGRTTLDFHAYVRRANLMSGDMIATINVNAGGVKERCRAARGLVFRRN